MRLRLWRCTALPALSGGRVLQNGRRASPAGAGLPLSIPVPRRPTCCCTSLPAGDALYAFELALSLEKLNFQKLRALHEVAEKHGDSQMCDFIGEAWAGRGAAASWQAAACATTAERFADGLLLLCPWSCSALLSASISAA